MYHEENKQTCLPSTIPSVIPQNSVKLHKEPIFPYRKLCFTPRFPWQPMWHPRVLFYSRWMSTLILPHWIWAIALQKRICYFDNYIFTRVATVDVVLWEDTRIVPVMGNTVNME